MSFEEWYKENISCRESKIFLDWDVDHYTFPTTQHHYSAYQAGKAEQKELDAQLAERPRGAVSQRELRKGIAKAIRNQEDV